MATVPPAESPWQLDSPSLAVALQKSTHQQPRDHIPLPSPRPTPPQETDGPTELPSTPPLFSDRSSVPVALRTAFSPESDSEPEFDPSLRPAAVMIPAIVEPAAGSPPSAPSSPLASIAAATSLPDPPTLLDGAVAPSNSHRRTASENHRPLTLTPRASRAFYRESTAVLPPPGTLPPASSGIITLSGVRGSTASPDLSQHSLHSPDLLGPSDLPIPDSPAHSATFPPHRTSPSPTSMSITLQRNNTGLGERVMVRQRGPINVRDHGPPVDPTAALRRNNTYGLAASPVPGVPAPDDQVDWDTAKQDLKRQRRSSRRKRDADAAAAPEFTIGTRIDEHHVNYVLMYNMLTGIRVSVSRCSGKPQRPLSSADFRAANKLAFDVTGDELTPSSRYDFKFKDYAPWVFRHIRDIFRLDSAEYLMSLTSKYILSEVGSAGKSGSFFYYSQDYRFIIKTVHHTEHRFMRRILPHYYEHIRKNPNTLICRIYGLHRVKLPHSHKIHFVVMSNVFPPNKDIHETFDLKGSTQGRFLSEEAQQRPRAVMKDLNWMQMGRKIELGPVKRGLFVEQLERDVELLKRLNIMDYSLLIGIHDRFRGNKDNIRDNTLSVFEPNAQTMSVHPVDRRSSKIMAMRKAIVESDPLPLEEAGAQLPDATFRELRNSLFYRDSGGFLATDESDRPTNKIYYMGVIDILTPYNSNKRFEHIVKAVVHDRHTISAVHPREYAHRFLDFMINALQHHDDIPPVTMKSRYRRKWE
ncbi:Phosphatidylinositol-4-phosphate 5-kinase [Tieghemiomyces parasiticus]|uniref:1-phosphatidylinositol-4-phosphate 5-kinase n=1 Tax=Tieghemiomyces parasiticus TaxID=78921 RepID=A0A9W8DZ62_9FUNG|nr:Phosphatidylinositol-4-phosphate 5-kinase [Tieghemiomyces parasiticus]